MFRSLRKEAKTLKLILYRNLYARPKVQKDIVEGFHKLFYDARLFGGTHGDTYWLGTPIYKCPMDLMAYQEILFETKPDVILETGTMDGGSAHFLSSMCDLVDCGEVITIDIEHREGRPQHDRLTYILGSSVADEIVEKVRERVAGKERVLAILDSDHTKKHVMDELGVYAPMVTPGSYLIVEDTNMNGHPVAEEFGPGPMEAVEEFLEGTNDFEIDKSREKFYLTFNPSGYLKRVR
jgi:cephalosporin hydroxylase